jgi:hypothetical protein
MFRENFGKQRARPSGRKELRIIAEEVRGWKFFRGKGCSESLNQSNFMERN